MKPSIQKFQVAFLLVLYAVAFVFFHMFPEKTNASSTGARGTQSAAATPASAAATD